MTFRNVLWWQYAFLSNELDTPKILACPGDRVVRLADSWGTDPNGGLLNASFQNNACSFALGLDAGVTYLKDGTRILDYSSSQEHILLMDRNPKVDPGALSCSSGISPANQLPFSGGTGNSGWLPIIHGPASGNVATLDGMVASVTSLGLNDLIQLGDANGSPHILLPR